jgi:hypothetical protein
MERTNTKAGSRIRAAVASAVMLAGLIGAGCGSGSDYKNKLRPPTPINITASISPSAVSASPSIFGAGPIVLVVTNQTDTSQEVTFETEALGTKKPGVTQKTGPINPQGTGELKVDVTEGTYRIRTENDTIQPAMVTVGTQRESSQNKVLQP